MKMNWKLPLAARRDCRGLGPGWLSTPGPEAQVVGVLKQLSQSTAVHAEEPHPDKIWVESSAARTKAPWDRTLTLTADQIKAIGLRTVAVKQQTEPTVLRLSGTTDYDPATVTVVRTQFDSRVDKVLVDLGSTVKMGDPLLELFSTDLAEAKSNYETAVSQWTATRKCSITRPRWPRRTPRSQGVDRGRERRGQEPARDEARQGQAAGLRPDRERDRERPKPKTACRRPG